MDNKLIIRRLFKAAVALLLIGALGYVTYIRATEEPPGITSIEDIQRSEGKSVFARAPEERRFVDYLRADATLSAPRRYVLRASLSEKVERVEVEVGDTVREGQPLVSFRKEDIESEIRAAAARLEEAEKNYHRFQNLLERGVVAEDAVEARLTARQNAHAAWRRAQSMLEFTQVTAPTHRDLDYGDGNVLVSARDVHPGEYRAAGQPLLTLTDMSVVDIEARMPESSLRYVVEGGLLEFRLGHEEKWRTARIQRISPETDDPHRFFIVYARTENIRENGLWLLRPGMYAEARIVGEKRDSAMAVPASALRMSGEGCCSVSVAEIVEERATNPGGYAVGVARELSIVTGLRAEDRVEVVSPRLSGDELIILNPRLDLRDGDRVRVITDR